MSIKNGENKGSRVSSKLVCIKELLVCGGETERNAALELRYRDMFSPIFKGVAVVLSYIQFSISFFFSHTSDVCREIPLCLYDQMDLKLKFTAQGNIANYHAD
jgi:hypothetical protein